jgi:subtilisin family serine protease
MPDDFLPRPVADTFARRVAPPELYDPRKRREWKLGRHDDERGPYVVEFNLQHIEGLPGAVATLDSLLKRINTDDPPRAEYISKTYSRVMLTVAEWQRLLVEDDRQAVEKAEDSGFGAPAGQRVQSIRFRAIYKLWPDFPVHSHIYKSVATIKSDASVRSFGAGGSGIVWAVVDSGIERGHHHFDLPSGHTLDSPEVRDLHRCFVDTEATVEGLDIPFVAPAPADPDALDRPGPAATEEDHLRFLARRRALLDEHRERALADDFGHGTHVAGIIAGAAKAGVEIRLLERTEHVNADGELERGRFELAGSVAAEQLRGMAPNCLLISLRVLNSQGEGRSSHVIRALAYIHERLNDNPKLLRVHGVNLSVGYEFDAEMFACGQSPICAEVNRLVQSGVVVVAAAGNTGFGTVSSMVRPTKVGLSNTINDPGNAELAITVGATHRDSPYTYGVSYFSSKGPTGDGRLKPDLVAPGERITSCGAGRRLKKVKDAMNLTTADGAAYYMEDSGTSMAAPHVSGAIAAFLSIRREFIGKPLEVKKIFLSTASPLGRERYFEGHGLIDLIRAIQSV